MKGSAPKCSKMGSQTRVTKKAQPNLCRESAEFTHSSYTSRLVIRITLVANRRVISSPLRKRRNNARGPQPGPGRSTAMGAVAILANLRDRLHLLFDDLFRQLRVGQRLSILLAVFQHPAEKARDDVALLRVLNLSGDQQPGKTRDRVGRFARRIGDRDPEVVGHGLRGFGSGCSDTRQVRLDETAGGIPYSSVG